MSILPLLKTANNLRLNRQLTRFRGDEGGGLIIFSLLVLISMLVLGGMAVDFMRQENQRVVLQGVADRSVLAGASLEQSMDGDELVEDYFLASGYDGTIIGTPTYEDAGNSKRVSVTARDSLDTFFLRLIGIDQLSSTADASAIEAVGKVEISLIVDISGSMRFDGENPRVTEATIATGGRINDLRIAAKAFATTVLDPQYNGEISLNIVPYAGHTNPGRDMFEILGGQDADSDDFDIPFDAILPGTSNPVTEIVYDDVSGEFVLLVNSLETIRGINNVVPRVAGSVAYPLVDTAGDPIQVAGADGTTLETITNEMITGVVQFGTPDPVTGVSELEPWTGDLLNPDAVDATNFMLDPGNGDALEVRYSPPHACMELTTASNWTSTGPPVSDVIVPQFMRWDTSDWETRTGLMGWGWCPHNTTSIKYAIQTAAEAVDYIDKLQLFDGTGTQNAMKWGLATLDPDMQPHFAALNARSSTLLPDDFVNRPASYSDPETRKIIILMTDGAVTDQYRPIAGYETDLANLINPSPSDIDSHDDWMGGHLRQNEGEQSITTAAVARDTQLDGLCTLAKNEGIEVYTVAFEISGSNAQAMRDCATPDTVDVQYYYETAGAGLTDVFQEIAAQVSDLRLVR